MTQSVDLHIAGLPELRESTLGDPSVVIAVIDGIVDFTHPCFEGAHVSTKVMGQDVVRHETADHGTFVASLIAGQPGTSVQGIAPHCTLMTVPTWTPEQPRPSQLDLARAIETAVARGANIINLSGGQYSDTPLAQDHLERAVQLCIDEDVLLIAAAGNDGCECLHVPAALEGVLAVGSHGETDASNFSNFHELYQRNGLSAPGENITGARAGGSLAEMSGTSFAAPLVAGCAGLLLSLARQSGSSLRVRDIGRALLHGADTCESDSHQLCQRLLGRTLNVEGARQAMNQFTNNMEGTRQDMNQEVISVGAEQSCGCGNSVSESPSATMSTAMPAAAVVQQTLETPMEAVMNAIQQSAVVIEGAEQSGHPIKDQGSLIYALGTLGFDFGTEARRDSFKQTMVPLQINGALVPPNPYDARQLVEHLRAQPSEARALIWTVNLELTPIYAVEAVGPYAAEINAILVSFLANANASTTSAEFIERVSVPGTVSGRSVRLFSGQVVPVVEIDAPRGLYGWQVNRLIADAISAVDTKNKSKEFVANLNGTLRNFFDRVYYEIRNLGRLSPDRALNFAATNAFQATKVFSETIALSMRLDTIEVERSPYARPDADAWDIKLKFFDPENTRRARTVFRFTIDVSDVMPVSVGEVRSWSSSS
jgi:cyanobactin maturation PatA/PatG family protease